MASARLERSRNCEAAPNPSTGHILESHCEKASMDHVPRGSDSPGSTGVGGPHPGPLSVERLSRSVAACGLVAYHSRRSHDPVLLLAARGALGGVGEAAEEGHLLLVAGLAGDWFYGGRPLRAIGRTGAALPGRAANHPDLYFA